MRLSQSHSASSELPSEQDDEREGRPQGYGVSYNRSGEPLFEGARSVPLCWPSWLFDVADQPAGRLNRNAASMRVVPTARWPPYRSVQKLPRSAIRYRTRSSGAQARSPCASSRIILVATSGAVPLKTVKPTLKDERDAGETDTRRKQSVSSTRTCRCQAGDEPGEGQQHRQIDARASSAA